MATKTKKNLWRIQTYLPAEAYKIFEEQLLEFNRVREQNGETKLTESAYSQFKLTGEIPRLQGAPKGNQNARRRKVSSNSKSSKNVSVQMPFAKQHSKIKIDLLSVSHNTKLVDENLTEITPLSAASDDEKFSSEGICTVENFDPEITNKNSGSSVENEKPESTKEILEIEEERGQISRRFPALKVEKSKEEKVLFSDDEIDEIIGNFDELEMQNTDELQDDFSTYNNTVTDDQQSNIANQDLTPKKLSLTDDSGQLSPFNF